jgi:cell division protein FtsW
MKKKVDIVFLISFILLLVVGLTVFVSAALGILANNQAKFTSVMFNQIFFGLIGGLILCFVASIVNYRYLRKYSLWIFLLSVVVAAIVFIPGVGVTRNGATRWIEIFGISFQPLELLKIGFIIYFAAWISGIKDKIKTLKFGLLPFFVLIGIVGALLLSQPDTDSFLIITAVGLVMYLIGGGKWRHVFFVVFLGLVGLATLVFYRPYLLDRIKTFVNPGENALTSGYQIQQSLIAVGSGEVFGRGLGQSVQKFKFLPESIGDAIFPIAAEEFGFVGAVVIIFLFLFFAARGLRIARQAPDVFGGLLVSGIVILITIQSFINIAAMIGVIPLSGSPLIFFSQGGTALMFALIEVGIVLNVSRYRKSN